MINPSIFRFSDGVNFDLRGPLRVVSRRDGWYVVGQGTLIPVDDREDGTSVISDLNKTNLKKWSK